MHRAIVLLVALGFISGADSLKAAEKKPASVYEFSISELQSLIDSRYVFLRSGENFTIRRERTRTFRSFMAAYIRELQAEMQRNGMEINAAGAEEVAETKPSPMQMNGPADLQTKAAKGLVRKERAQQLELLERISLRVYRLLEPIEDKLLGDAPIEDLDRACQGVIHEIHYATLFSRPEGTPLPYTGEVAVAVTRALCYGPEEKRREGE